MDERRLRYFLAVVDEGGVTRAAAALHVAQPSLSQALRALERELGVELFHRAGRGLRLSSAGEAFAGQARQVLVAMDAARGAVAQVSALLAGTLHLAALATLAVDPLATLIGRFRLAHPGVTVRVHEPDGAADVGARVRDGACELGLAHLPLRDQDLLPTPLGEQELMFVLPPEASLPIRRGGERSARALAPSALRAIPLVVSPPGTSTRTLLEQALDAVGVTPLIAVETAAREAIVPLVLAGAGAALLPTPLAREAERRGALAYPARPRIVRRIGLVQRRGALSPAASAFVEIATRAARAQTRAARTGEGEPASGDSVGKSS